MENNTKENRSPAIYNYDREKEKIKVNDITEYPEGVFSLVEKINSAEEEMEVKVLLNTNTTNKENCIDEILEEISKKDVFSEHWKLLLDHITQEIH